MPTERGPFFHGGLPDLDAGQLLLPSPPHVVDGCPICVARAAGRTCTVGAYRFWLRLQGPRAVPILRQLAGVDDDEPIDPPTGSPDRVYVTTDLEYARFYASKRPRGDLYRVQPLGPLQPSPEDHFRSWTCEAAEVVHVIDRRVRLTRTQRRQLLHRWKKADARAAKAQA